MYVNYHLMHFPNKARPQLTAPLSISDALEQEIQCVVDELQSQLQQTQDNIQYLSEVTSKLRSFSSLRNEANETHHLPLSRLPMPDVEEAGSTHSSMHNSDVSLFGA